jgi:biotin transport system substrate-specific component
MQTYAGAVLSTAVFPRTRLVRIALVVGFALLTALAAQFEIHLGFSPVPVTGQTLAVLLSGGVLGWRAGLGSQLLYVVLGGVGLPFYAGGEEGWQHLLGATGGYLVGFVVAAALVGWLAERHADRRVPTAIPSFLAGNAVIYLFGVPWLAAVVGLSPGEALVQGLLPFVIGDLLKIGLAGILLPAGWWLVDLR